MCTVMAWIGWRKALAVSSSLLALGLWCVPLVRAADVISSLDMARNHDPVLQSAVQAHQVSLTRIPQARAAFLPVVNLTTQNNISKGNYTFSGNEPNDRSLRSNSQTLQLTQALYRPAQTHALAQAELQAVQTLAQLHQAEQDLMQRLLQAYLELQIAINQQDVVSAQLKTQDLQLAVARRGLTLGVKTLPEVYEAQSKLSTSESQVVEAATQWRVKRQELFRITGESLQQKPAQWQALADNFPLQNWMDKSDAGAGINASTLAFWAEQARLEAPAVRAQAVAVEIALREIHKNRAAHLPTVDLTVSRARNSSIGNATTAQNYDSASRVNQLGVQVTVPLYAGGGTAARVREAVSAWEKAQFDLEAAQLLAESNAVQAFEGRLAAQAQIQALQIAIDAAQLAVTGNAAGVRLGTRTPLDVLTSEQQLATARKDWRKARYDLILQTGKLKSAVGLLEREDFMALNQGFYSLLPAAVIVAVATAPTAAALTTATPKTGAARP